MTSLALILLALSVRDDATDRKLSERIRKSDTDAYREFFEKYQGLLLSFLMSKGMDRDDAEDLVQMAFMIIWDKRGDINPDRSLKSFLFTIAYNRMLNHFRDKKDGDPEYAFRLVDTGQNPEDAAISEQIMKRIQKAISRLPEKRRMVFELCYLQELSYREAAEALNVSRKTIENHMAFALKELRSALEKFTPE